MKFKNKITILGLVLIVGILPTLGVPPKNHFYAEKEYQNMWCSSNGGVMEVILFDKARVDCVTKTHAIEFDFAKKWGESIGQSLYYASVLNKKPGIVLIMENGKDDIKYLERVNKVARNYGITVWTTKPNDMLLGKIANKNMGKFRN